MQFLPITGYIRYLLLEIIIQGIYLLVSFRATQNKKFTRDLTEPIIIILKQTI